MAHDFLPASVAGVEVYTLELALRSRREGVDAAVLHPVRGPGLDQYALDEGNVRGVRVFCLVQNYPYRPLAEGTVDPQADRRFLEVLDRFRPDLVHVQHLWGWSAALPALARARGLPVVVHLHDHWLACPSGGQRYHPDGTVCEDLDRVDCDACYARFRSTEGPLERAALRAARRIPRPLPPDLLHRAFAGLPPMARAVLKRLNERRAGADSVDDQAGMTAGERRQAYTSGLAAADAVLAPSRDIGRRMAALGLDPDRLRHVPNGTDVPAAPGVPPGVDDPSRPLTLLFLGTPVAHKGLHVLAEAARQTTAEVQLVVNGRDPSPAYRARCDGSRVRFAGPLDRDRVPAAIDAADLVCLPSLWPENAPLTLLEARARGRAVLASAVGGVAETAQGELLPPGDVAAWTRALDHLGRDRGLLAELTARVTAPRTMGENARQVLAIYREVTDARTDP